MYLSLLSSILDVYFFYKDNVVFCIVWFNLERIRSLLLMSI